VNKAEPQQPQGSGLPYAFSAYLIWGFLPVYFKLLTAVPAIDILAYRIVWSVPLVFAILYFRKQWGEFIAAITNPAARRAMMLSAVLIAINWLVYVWAIGHDRILATSIGYYLNPLVNVLLGRLFLGERLTKLQGWAVAIAALAVAVLMSGTLETVWISLTLAFSFGTYGLVRKMAPTGSVPGLAVEMCLLGPIALVICIWGISQTGGLRDFETEMLLALGPISCPDHCLHFGGVCV
jgi:chloramphenicol-sensitive protein RarD